MDGGAWWAAVYGVAQSRTRLKQLRNSSSRGITNYVLQSPEHMKIPKLPHPPEFHLLRIIAG